MNRTEQGAALAAETLDSIVTEYAVNKAVVDRLGARNAELAEKMRDMADFADGSDSARFTAGGYRVTVTRRVNERWDQDKLCRLRDRLDAAVFATLFRERLEPDRRCVRAFLQRSPDAAARELLEAACEASEGRPGIRLETLC